MAPGRILALFKTFSAPCVAGLEATTKGLIISNFFTYKSAILLFSSSVHRRFLQKPLPLSGVFQKLLLGVVQHKFQQTVAFFVAVDML